MLHTLLQRIEPERRCARCGSDHTYVNKLGYSCWARHSTYVGWLCQSCHRLLRYHDNKNTEAFKIKQKEYYQQNRERILDNQRRYVMTNKGQISRKLCQARYRLKHRDLITARSRARRTLHPQKYRAIAKKHYAQKLKGILFQILGGPRCSSASCLVPGGCSDIRCLQFDHINGGGSADMRRFRNPAEMYRYYSKHPEDAKKTLQVLCANCNWIKRYDKEESPNKNSHV